ncbi:AraC family transcriptional regulator [Cohnella zeiphila]|uniref:Helix-turn-helix transcriptional regulator n=1 Tax=Cohnella zeiphila TaxID=2761120 RepID=A0A7X0SGG3_9BACL|nr:AraC family transcriptional regulator [Cohnella zeiphila]MBB6729482.1 helix-turn-helix transcriptional regulator [Cohnella zeiphila]
MYLHKSDLDLYNRAKGAEPLLSQENFLYVMGVLNESVRTCECSGVEYQIFNWGVEWCHFDNPVHRHSFYEICYVLEGKGEYEDEEVIFPLENGTLFASLPGHWHQIRSGTGLKLFFVAFEVVGGASSDAATRSEAARRYESELDDYSSPIAQEPEGVTALLWRALYHHILQLEAGADARTSALCGMLLRSFPATFGAQEESAAVRAKSLSRSRSHLAQLAKRFIRDNLSRPLRLEDVSAYLNISGRHLTRIFKEEAGLSFGDYVTRERMLAAESLLKTTVHSVKEIADLTGYQSVHYFTRVFSERYGTPPAEYRRTHFQERAD